MSKRTNIQSTYAPTAGAPRKSTQKIMGLGAVWGRQYTKKDTFISIFFMIEEASYIDFWRCKPTKNTSERRRDTIYSISNFVFFLNLGFFKMQLMCGEISGFQVLQINFGLTNLA